MTNAKTPKSQRMTNAPSTNGIGGNTKKLTIAIRHWSLDILGNLDISSLRLRNLRGRGMFIMESARSRLRRSPAVLIAGQRQRAKAKGTRTVLYRFLIIPS